MTTAIRSSSISLAQLELPASPYVSYTYSYPHKTAYRPLMPPRKLHDVWADERKNALFLYMHVPFCEMRCGFCNLFTTANPADEVVSAYLGAIRRQAQIVRDAIGPMQAARAAIGGGTPTYLAAADLERLLVIMSDVFGIAPGSVPISVETSPRTAEPDRLRVLKDFGVGRISIGVQSFIEAEVAASARAQKNEWVQTALQRIRDLQFPALNIDLIYGLPGQSVCSWLQTIREALRWWPEELYLYPLYVRPLTGLNRHGCQTSDDVRLDCYRAGRDLLLAEGYERVSMRMFRRAGADASSDDPVYCCQDDGMVGLGCGARSYTRRLHYSTDYAVESSGVREIIGSYLARSDQEFQYADYGCEVSDEEYRRRWVIKSLLRASGLDHRLYVQTFETQILDDFPQLSQLLADGYLEIDESTLRPTAKGLEWSDAIGPSLFSDDVRQKMRDFDTR